MQGRKAWQGKEQTAERSSSLHHLSKCREHGGTESASRTGRQPAIVELAGPREREPARTRCRRSLGAERGGATTRRHLVLTKTRKNRRPYQAVSLIGDDHPWKALQRFFFQAGSASWNSDRVAGKKKDIRKAGTVGWSLGTGRPVSAPV